MTAPPRLSRRPNRLRRAAWQLGLAVGLLVVAELLLRAGGVVPPSRSADPFVGFSGDAPFFEYDAELGALRTAPARRRHFNDQSFVTPKPDGVRRIVCLGGSTTYGRPYGDPTSFAGWLREALREAAPDERWEVLNAGAISYASYRVARVQAELLELAEPDLFIIYTGHNEFLEARTYGDSLREPSLLRRLSGRLADTALFGLAQRALGGGTETSEPASDATALLPDEVAPLLDASVGLEAYTRDDDVARDVLRHFAATLTRMVESSAAAGVPVLLVVPASELAGCAPFKSDPSDPARDARRLYNSGMGELLMAAPPLGDTDTLARAQDLLRRARDEDLAPLRAPSAFTQTVRDVAADTGAWLLNAEALLAARAERLTGVPIPGSESFLDHVHMTPQAYGELAFALLDELAARDLVQIAPAFDATARAALGERVLARLGTEDHVRAFTRLAAVLDWAGKAEEAEALTQRAQALGAGGSAFAHWQEGHFARRRGELTAATEAYQRAVDVDPGYTEAHFNLAEVLLQLRRSAEALVHFERAQQLNASLLEAGYGRGLALGQLGRRDEERTAYTRVLETDPEHAGAWTRLALSLVADERLDEALVTFERGRGFVPDDAALAYNHGVLLRSRGQADAARAAFSSALAADPEHARAARALGELDDVPPGG